MPASAETADDSVSAWLTATERVHHDGEQNDAPRVAFSVGDSVTLSEGEVRCLAAYLTEQADALAVIAASTRRASIRKALPATEKILGPTRVGDLLCGSAGLTMSTR